MQLKIRLRRAINLKKKSQDWTTDPKQHRGSPQYIRLLVRGCHTVAIFSLQSLALSVFGFIGLIRRFGGKERNNTTHREAEHG